MYASSKSRGLVIVLVTENGSTTTFKGNSQ